MRDMADEVDNSHVVLDSVCGDARETNERAVDSVGQMLESGEGRSNGNDEITEEVEDENEINFDDFQVIDECNEEDDEADYHEGTNISPVTAEKAKQSSLAGLPDSKKGEQSKKAENGKAIAKGECSSKPKSERNTKTAEVRKRERSSERSSSKRARDDDKTKSRNRSYRSRSRRSRSRSRRSRSRSYRRRSRSKSKRNDRRSRSRQNSRKAPEKKPPTAGTTTKNATKKEDPTRKTDKSATSPDKKSGCSKSTSNERKISHKPSGPSESKKEQVESAAVKDTKEDAGSKGDDKSDVVTKASGVEIEEGKQESVGRLLDENPVDEKIEIFEEVDKNEERAANISAGITDAVVNDAGTAGVEDTRKTPSVYDGDILEIAVPEDATLEEGGEAVGSYSGRAAVPVLAKSENTGGLEAAAMSKKDDLQRATSSKDVIAKDASKDDKEQKTKDTPSEISQKSNANKAGTKECGVSRKCSESKSRYADGAHDSSSGGAATQKQSKKNESEKEKIVAKASAKSKETKTAPHASTANKKTESQRNEKTDAGCTAGQTSETATGTKATATGKMAENVAIATAKGDISGFVKEPLKWRRKEPVSQVKAYIDSILNLQYDVKVYCCFYCVACPLLLPTTQRYEEHLSTNIHKQNVVRWRICQDLQGEELMPQAKRQLDVENFAETVVGADQVVELCNNDGVPCNFVCVMCSSLLPDVDALLSHLSSFLHIENYMEKIDSSLFDPPAVSCAQFESVSLSSRQDDPAHVAKILSAARCHMMRHGRGCMRSYVGDKYHDINCDVFTELEEMEETVMMSLMEQLFADDGSYKFKWKRIDIKKSVGNETYQKQPTDVKDRVVGLQTIVEMWFPNRRMPPVFYCTVCNYMVTNVINHCSVIKHWIEYFRKYYKPIYECLILEADDEQMLKESLLTTVTRVLQTEGSSGRIKDVIQVLVDPVVVFCAVNAQIAKQIVDEMGFKVTIPKGSHLSSGGASKSEVGSKKIPARTNKNEEIAKKAIVSKPLHEKKPVPSKPTGTAARKATGTARDVNRKAPAVKGSGNLRQGANRGKAAGADSNAAARRVNNKLASGATFSRAERQRPNADGERNRGRQSASTGQQRSNANDKKPLPRKPNPWPRQDERRRVAPPTAPAKQIVSTMSRRQRARPQAQIRQQHTNGPSSDQRRDQHERRMATLDDRKRARTRSPVRSMPRRSVVDQRQRGKSPLASPTKKRVKNQSTAIASGRQRQHHEDVFNRGSNGGMSGRVNGEDLRRLTEVLRTYVGLDYGRELSEEDLDVVRAGLPPGTLDDLLELLRRAPTMSFHNFFAQRCSLNTAPTMPVGDNWPIRDEGVFQGNLITNDPFQVGIRNEECQFSNRRRSSFDEHHSFEPHRGSAGASKKGDRGDGGSYSQHRRQFESRPDRSSMDMESMRRSMFDNTSIDDRSNMGFVPPGASVAPGFSIVQSYENPSASGSVIGNEAVVYAQPVPPPAFPEQPFAAQQAHAFGGIFGRTHGQDLSGVAYGIPIQGVDNGSVFMPVASAAANAAVDFWPPLHHRRGHHDEENVRKW